MSVFQLQVSFQTSLEWTFWNQRFVSSLLEVNFEHSYLESKNALLPHMRSGGGRAPPLPNVAAMRLQYGPEVIEPLDLQCG